MSCTYSIAKDKRVIFSPANVQYNGRSFGFAKTQNAVCAAENADRYFTMTDLFQITSNDEVLTYLGTYVTEQYRQWIDALQGQWFIPTVNQWKYLLSERSTSVVSGVKNARFLKCTVRGTACLMLFPDEFSFPDDVELPAMQRVNDKFGDFSKVKYDYKAMLSLEKAGCILLPAIDWDWEGDLCIRRISHGQDYPSGEKLISGNYWAMADDKNDEQFHHFIFSSKHYQIGSYRPDLEYSAFIRLVRII